MKLTKVEGKKPVVELDVNDYFTAKTAMFGTFELRQVVRVKDGYGIVRVRDGKLMVGSRASVEKALEGYEGIVKVKLEEIVYSEA